MYKMTKSIIDEGYAFIMNNLDNIILAFLFILIGFIYAVLHNISFKNNKDFHHKTKKVIVYETFDVKDEISDDDTTEVNTDNCKTLHGESHKIEEYCQSLHPKLCKHKKCCILGKESKTGDMKCFAGSRIGPTYHTTDDGNDINLDYYYYQGKCYGKKCE